MRSSHRNQVRLAMRFIVFEEVEIDRAFLLDELEPEQPDPKINQDKIETKIMYPRPKPPPPEPGE